MNVSEVWDTIMCPIILTHGLGESCLELSLCYLVSVWYKVILAYCRLI